MRRSLCVVLFALLPALAESQVPRDAVGPEPFLSNNQAEIAWRNATTGHPQRWFFDQNTRAHGVFVRPDSPSDSDWVVVGATDFDRDGKEDVLWRNPATGKLVAWLLDGVGTTRTDFVQDQGAEAVPAVGDFNLDGKPDLFWRHSTSGAIEVWLMDGLSLTAAVSVPPGQTADTAWVVAGTGDYDRDGRVDVCWWNRTTLTLRFWLMGGSNNGGIDVRQSVDLPPGQNLPTSLQPAATPDVNGDGWTDIVWQDRVTGRVVAWLMGGQGSGLLVARQVELEPRGVDIFVTRYDVGPWWSCLGSAPFTCVSTAPDGCRRPGLQNRSVLASGLSLDATDAVAEPASSLACTEITRGYVASFSVGPWSDCSAPCGGGIQTRTVQPNGWKADPPDADRPNESQGCNMQGCLLTCQHYDLYASQSACQAAGWPTCEIRYKDDGTGTGGLLTCWKGFP